jgi:hypothetical protein
MADMGIYSLWPVLTALDLGVPLSAEAWSTHTCSILDQVSREAKNDFSFPAACTLRFKFAARGDMPALDLFWYDGGMKPRMPEAIEAANPEIQKEGILFIGDRGTIMADFNGQGPRLFAKGKSEPLWPEEAEQAGAGRRRRAPGGRGNVWLPSLKGGELSPGNFLNAASISDTVNLGTVALRAGTKVLFDSEAMKITNVPDANKYLYREYRQGWEL